MIYVTSGLRVFHKELTVLSLALLVVLTLIWILGADVRSGGVVNLLMVLTFIISFPLWVAVGIETVQDATQDTRQWFIKKSYRNQPRKVCVSTIESLKRRIEMLEVCKCR